MASVPGWGDIMEEGMAIHSSTLAWRVHRTEETGRLQSIGWQKWDTGEVTERSGIGIQLIYTSLETISGFPGGSGSKVSAWNAGDLGSVPGLG